MNTTNPSQHRSKHAHTHHHLGLSLVEAIAVIVVLAIIGGSSAGLLVRAASAYAVSRDTAATHREASAALERITRELREAPPAETNDAAQYRAPIHEATTTTLRFGAGRWFTLENNTINWSEDDATTFNPLLTDVRSFTIVCLDDSQQPIPMPLQPDAIVHAITIAIEAGEASRPVTLRSSVFLRANLARLDMPE